MPVSAMRALHIELATFAICAWTQRASNAFLSANGSMAFIYALMTLRRFPPFNWSAVQAYADRFSLDLTLSNFHD